MMKGCAASGSSVIATPSHAAADDRFGLLVQARLLTNTCNVTIDSVAILGPAPGYTPVFLHGTGIASQIAKIPELASSIATTARDNHGSAAGTAIHACGITFIVCRQQHEFCCETREMFVAVARDESHVLVAAAVPWGTVIASFVHPARAGPAAAACADFVRLLRA
eukprot:m.113223 g.113223  ORF g.113223 m.113223 type:complete len:166 (+) comp17069_c0_seq1:330-827(+)